MSVERGHVSLRQVVRNFSALSLAEAARVGLSAIATVYLARTLGADGFGIYGFAVAVLGYFTTAVDSGSSLLGARDIARDRSQVAHQVRIILGLRLALACLAAVALFIFTLLIDKPAMVERVVLLSGFSLFTYALMLDWVFYGLEQVQFAAMATVAKMIVFSATVLLLIQASEQVWLTPLLQAAGESAALLLLLAVYARRFGWPWPSIDWRAWRGVLQKSLPIGLGHALRAINYSASVILIGFMLNETAVGLFVGAQKLVLFVLGFGGIYFFAYLPSIARSFGDQSGNTQQLLARSIHLTTLFTVPLAIGATILGPKILELVYGAPFANAVQPFEVLAWSVPLIILGGHFRQALFVANLQRLDVLWVAISAATNIALNLLLIPMLGLTGAALATVVGEAVLTVLGYISTSRRVLNLSFASQLLRPLFAAGLMAGVLWWQRNFWIPISILSGTLVYFGLLVALGEIRPQQVLKVFRSRIL